jgi:hypothetical protein
MDESCKCVDTQRGTDTSYCPLHAGCAGCGRSLTVMSIAEPEVCIDCSH